MRRQPASVRFRALAIGCFGAVLALTAIARISSAETTARPAAAPTPSPRSWLQGNRVRLTVVEHGGAKSVTYTFAIAPGGDMRIGIEEREGGTDTSRELLLISGRFLAVRGAKLPPGYEIDALDAAALSWQLAGRLLTTAAPGDPSNLRAPVRIALSESRAPISVSTNSAEETFPPPWSARGRVNPIGDGRIDFDFAFSFHSSVPPSEAMEVHYSGRWENASPALAIEDGTSLSGWSVYVLGSRRRNEKGQGEMVDFGATPVKSAYGTVGDLRRLARAGKP
jgi:hypothetical protein